MANLPPMPQTPTAVAIYARISSDTEGSGLGVARQVKDCRRLAESLGWTVAEEYLDNDLSAYSGKARPDYQRMLADLRDGLRDGVIVYHVDRLTRRPIELEEFVATVDAAKVRHVRFVVGDMNLGNGDGLMIARIMAAMAANESATKSRRLQRKWEQNAEAGLPHGGSWRPFGYADDKVTIREDEAALYRTVAARFLAGDSLRSLAAWLDEQGSKPLRSSHWRTHSIKHMLVNPRYAGLRTYHGVVVGPASWPAIISEDDHRRIVARFAEKATTKRRVPQRYLLSGLLRCGKCGGMLFSSRRQNSRRYVCLSGADHRGCGGLTVVADPLERFLADAVLIRLDTKDMADALSGKHAAEAHTAALAESISEDKARLNELAEAYGRRDVGMAEWMTARKIIESGLVDKERRLARASHTDTLQGLVGNGDALRAQWASLNLTRQHAIVRAVLDHAVIGPGKVGARSLDIDRVKPLWRHL